MWYDALNISYIYGMLFGCDRITEKSEKVNESQIDFLKPCLCGTSVPPLVSAYRKGPFDPNDWVHIMCPSCGWGTTILATVEKAVAEWNGREKKESEPKPCPFCGCGVSIVTIIEGIWGAPDYYAIVHPDDTDCIVDGMETSAYPNREELIEDWNRRVG